MEDRAVIKHDPRTSTAMALTERGATAILQKIWPQAPKDEIVRAAILCAQYGLNPLKKHVYLLKFTNRKTGEETWATVLGIAATRLIGSRSGAYSYVDGPRVMTAQEQVRIFGEASQDDIVAITVVQDERGNKAPGYGRWPKADYPYGADKGNTKANMAMIRSERAALDRLRPGEMPSQIEVLDIAHLPAEGAVSEGYIDTTGRTLPDEPSSPTTANATSAPLEHEGEDPLREPTPTRAHWCAEHNRDFFKTAKMKAYAHPNDDGTWHYEPASTPPVVTSDTPSADRQAVCPIHQEDNGGAVFMAATEPGKEDTKYWHPWGKINCVLDTPEWLPARR